jgi:hypothetical protein
MSLNMNDLNAVLSINGIPVLNQQQFTVLLNKNLLQDVERAVKDIPNINAISYITGVIGGILQESPLASMNQNNFHLKGSQDNQPKPEQRPQSSQAGSGDNNDVFGSSHHAYGSQWAICLSANKTKKGFNTVNIEVAKSIGEKVYDWKNKTIIQVTEAEFPSFVAMAIGVIPMIEFKYHGPNKDKGYYFENQVHKSGNYYAKIFATGLMANVKIMPTDFFYMSAIIIEQMKKNFPEDISYEAMFRLINSSFIGLQQSIVMKLNNQQGNNNYQNNNGNQYQNNGQNQARH